MEKLEISLKVSDSENRQEIYTITKDTQEINMIFALNCFLDLLSANGYSTENIRELINNVYN